MKKALLIDIDHTDKSLESPEIQNMIKYIKNKFDITDINIETIINDGNYENKIINKINNIIDDSNNSISKNIFILYYKNSTGKIIEHMKKIYDLIKSVESNNHVCIIFDRTLKSTRKRWNVISIDNIEMYFT